MRRPLLFITAAFGLGILSEGLLNIPVFYLAILAAAALLICVLFFNFHRPYLLFILAGFLFVGALDYAVYRLLPADHIKNALSRWPDFPEHVFIQGTIVNRPDKELTAFDQEAMRFLLRAEALSGGEGWQRISGRIQTQVIMPQADFRYGQRVVLEGKLTVPRPATNPGQFDYRKFLAGKKIYYILKVKKGGFTKIAGTGEKNYVKAAAYGMSEKLEGLIDEYLPGREGSVLKAILLGERRAIDDDINDNFTNTGTVHLLSISGLHVGLLALLFLLVFKILRVPFRLSTAMAALFLICYSVMVDNGPPVVRATIMILIFLFGGVLKRRHDALNSLAFAALLILFFNPQDLFEVGFQLSFVTVCFIIYPVPRLEKMFGIRPSSYMKRAAIVSICAWLASAPLIARYFNIVSPVTIIANLIVVPWMFFVLASSVAFISFGLISPVLASIFSGASGLSVLILLKAVSIFARIPLCYFRVKPPPWIFIAGFYLFLILFFERGRFKLRARHFLIAALILSNLFIWMKVFSGRRDLLEITFLDVGRGDSAFVEFPDGGTMLIDGGDALGADMGRLIVGRFLAHKGINTIDVVMATHPHTDHIGGLVAILQNFKVRYFIDNGDYAANPFCKKCAAILEKKRIRRFRVREGDRIEGFKNAAIAVLNPPRPGFRDQNDNSIVIKLAHGRCSVLFCGDIEEEAAAGLLLRHKEALCSTALKVPHHGGSLGEAGQAFLSAIRPHIVVISLGSRPPDERLLEELNGLGARVYRTDRDGAIILKNRNGEENSYCQFPFL